MGKQRKKLMIITAFIMSIMFTMAGWGFSMELSFLNEGHVLNLLEQSGFYESASEDIMDQIAGLTEQAGLPIQVLDGLEAEVDLSGTLKKYTTGKIHGVDSEELNKTLMSDFIRASVYIYMENEGISKSWIQTEAFTNYLDQADQAFIRTAQQNFFIYYKEIRDFYQTVCLGLGCVGLAIGISGVIFIYFLVKMRRKTLSYLIRSLVAAAIMTAGVPVIGMITGISEMAAVNAGLLGDFSKLYINSGLQTFFVTAGVYGALILVCAIVINLLGHHSGN